MKIYIKVAIAFFLIFFGIVVLMDQKTNKLTPKVFQLIEHVCETEIAYSTDFIKVLDELILYNSTVEKSLTNKIALNEFKKQLQNSGLILDKNYFTYSFTQGKIGSFYAEISDTILFEIAFKKFISFYNLNSLKGSANYYLSNNRLLSAEVYEKYIKINFGAEAERELFNKKGQPSLFFQRLLKERYIGVVNTTGTPQLDSFDYATFSYTYDKHFNLVLDWIVAGEHPLKQNQEPTIHTYPTQKNNLRTFINVDTDHLQSSINLFLKNKGREKYNKLPLAGANLLSLWNGKAYLQVGGKAVSKTVQHITEFDDNFNQVEKRIEKTDSITDIGFYWDTNQSKETLLLLNQLPNVKLKNNELQIALVPPLIIQSKEEGIKAGSEEKTFEKEDFEKIAFLFIDIPGLMGNMSIEKTNKHNARIHLLLKDWRLLLEPKKLGVNSFW